MHLDFTGKVVLVTGGSRGLGRSISEAFAEAGADLIVVSRKLEACVRVAEELQRAHGHQAVGLACHVGDWGDCARLVDAAYEAFGRVDVLVNNAGMSPAYDSLSDVSEALFDKIMAVNLKGPFRLSTLIGTRMAATGGGSIVNISSSSASHPLAAAAPYSAAKAGVNALTKAMASALGPTVRVNCVQPWGLETDMSRAIPPEVIADLSREHVIKRFARPEEVAGMVVFLASESASYITGAVMRVDGGMPG